MKNLFIKYLRVQGAAHGAGTHESPLEFYLRPIGVIVAESPTNIGWSLCGPKDHFSYKLARTIAMGRLAKKPKRLPPVEMITFITNTMPEIKRWYEKRHA